MMYSRCTLNQNLLTNYMKDDIFNIYALMVYFWTYAHPSYCPSDLLARGFTAARWTSGRSARSSSLS